MEAIASFTIFIFCFLSLMHFYWAFGGKLGSTITIPEVNGKAAFKPGFAITTFVALALFFCAVVVAVLSFNEILNFPFVEYFNYAGWFLAVIFLIRAIGDFKMLGFFKKKSKSSFAKWDSLLFSPLCLYLSLTMFYLTYH